MNKTKELLLKIRNAVASGALSADGVPIADVKYCVSAEIELYQNTMAVERFFEIKESYERLCSNLAEEETDAGKILLFLDATILCVDMLSDTIRSLANREYWEYKHQEHLHDPKVQEIIDYIDRHGELRLLSYDFMDEYQNLPVELCFDEECQMIFVPYKGRRMYFPASWDGQKVMEYYRSVVSEQDERSPHSYRHEGYQVQDGDVVVDVGAAEGIFALDVVDAAGKVYLIEADNEWIEALHQTFKGDGDKVQIIYGFADCVAEGDRVTLDSLFEEVNYIKMDIEGYEKPALLGAERLLRESKKLVCAICAYHCKEDEVWIRDYLGQRGFVTDVSEGYMCPDWTVEAYLEAELRRGVVFGKRG